MSVGNLEDRIHIASAADLDDLSDEIAALELDVTAPYGFHMWMTLGREMNKRYWLENGRGSARYYSGINAGLWPDVADLPTLGATISSGEMEWTTGGDIVTWGDGDVVAWSTGAIFDTDGDPVLDTDDEPVRDTG